MIEVNEYLDVRAVNVLHKAGVFTDDDLHNISRHYLLSLENCGRKTVNRICCYAESLGIFIPNYSEHYTNVKEEQFLTNWHEKLCRLSACIESNDYFGSDKLLQYYSDLDTVIDEMYSELNRLRKGLTNGTTSSIERQGFIYHK